MDSLSDFGCFVYYFNSLILTTGLYPEHFAHFPLVNTVLLLLGGGLSLLASRLLLRTIDLNFSEVLCVGLRELLLGACSKRRSWVSNISALLKLCLSYNSWGKIVYVIFMPYIVLSLVRNLLVSGFLLYVHTIGEAEFGWRWLMVLFAGGILVGSSLSLQKMARVQMVCGLLHIVCTLCFSLTYLVDLANAPESIWQTITAQYDTFLRSNHILIPSVLEASKSPPKRHIVLITWAVILALGINLLQYWIVGMYRPIISETSTLIIRRIGILLQIPVLFSSVHIYLRALTDVVITWRYSYNANKRYYWRIKAVRILLPLIVYLPIFALAYFDQSKAQYIVFLPFASTLATSTMYLIIPYCYNRTVQQIWLMKKTPAWWTNSLYAAWVFSLIAAIVNYSLYRTFADIKLGVSLSGSLYVVMVLWHIIGYFLSC